MAVPFEETLSDWQAFQNYLLGTQGAQPNLPINPATGSGTAPPAPAVQPTSGAEKIGLGGELSVMGGYGSGYNLNSPEYRAWMEAATKAGGMAGGPASTSPVDPTKMTAEEWAASRPEWNVTPSGPHPSDPGWQDENGDGIPDPPPPGLTGLPPSGPASTLPGNPGVTQGPAPMPGLVPNAASNAVNPLDTNGDGTVNELDEPGKNQTGFRDVDNNGIDDRNQTTVGGGPVGPNYADWWAQTLASNPQMGYGGNGQMGWGGAMTTGTGAPIELGGGGGGYGGGTAGGGNFSLPSAGGDFNIPPAPTANFPDLTQIGTGVSGGSGTGTGTGGFTIPEFQNPLAGYGTTGTGTTGTTTSTGTAPLAGYGGTGASPNAGLVSDLANSYQNQTDAANQANMSRYDQGLAALLDRMNRAGLAINNLTNEGIADIGRQFEGARATADQDLINRGLANTTVRSGVMRGLTTDQAAETNRYWDNQARQNLNEDYRQTGDIVNWIGGRNDVGPSTESLANLASGVGAAGPTTLTGSTSTTPAATQPAVNLPPQVTTALQNGTLMNYAPTQSGAAPATPGNTFLNQGAGITTPQQQADAANQGGTTRSQTAAPPPPATAESTPLSGYGSTSQLTEQQAAASMEGDMQRAMRAGMSGSQTRTQREMQAGAADTSGSSSIGGVRADGTMSPYANSATPSAESIAQATADARQASANFNSTLPSLAQAFSGYDSNKMASQLSRAVNPSGVDKSSLFDGTTAQMGPQSSINPNLAALGGQDTPQQTDPYKEWADLQAANANRPETNRFGMYDVPVTSTQGSMPTADYMLGQQPFMGGGNANNGMSGADANYAPSNYDPQSSGTRNGNTWMTDAAVSPVSKTKAPAPPPASPSVMGFPDPPVSAVAPGNPNDVTNAMRSQNPNNPQLSSGFRPPEMPNPAYGGTPGMASMSSPMAGYGQQSSAPKQANASTTSYGSGYGQSFSMPTPSSTPPMGVVPQRPEPVPFASAPPMSPMSGYGSSAMPGPSMMAPPGPAAAPTFQQYGAPGVQNKPPSLVGGVMMPQPPARRWGV